MDGPPPPLISHKAVMDMEIEFIHNNFTEKNPKLLMEHIWRMASGEALFFSTTLSLVYDGLLERVFTQSGSGSGKPTDIWNQSVPKATPTTQTSNPTLGFYPPFTFNLPSSPRRQPPAPVLEFETEYVPEPGPIPLGAVWLECFQCSQRARMRDLEDGLRCPRCPSRSAKKGRPFMQCPSCNQVRTMCRDNCTRLACQARFA